MADHYWSQKFAMSFNLADLMKGMQQAGNGIENQEDSDQDGLNEEDMDDEQKYKNWLANRPFLYDHLIVHKVDHPTLSIQWLPDSIESDNMINVKNKLVAGTFFQEGEQNYLNVYNVILPKFKGFVDLGAMTQPQANSDDKVIKSSIKLDKRFLHEGEVNRTQYMPKNSNILATKSNEGHLNIFHLDKPTMTGPVEKLTGLDSTGFAMNWSTRSEGRIISSGTDGIVGLWNYGVSAHATTIDYCKSAVNVIRDNLGHQVPQTS